MSGDEFKSLWRHWTAKADGRALDHAPCEHCALSVDELKARIEARLNAAVSVQLAESARDKEAS